MVALTPPSKCSKELANAVYDDFKKKAIDAAKKHAVSQNVDYDTFKNLVSVAHLRPLQAPNTRPTGAYAPSWSFAPDGTRIKHMEVEAGAASSALLSDQLPSEPPGTSADFQRTWSRNCPSADHKYRYLRLCGPEGLRQVFKVEISPALLKEIVHVLSTCWLVHAGVAEQAGEGGALQDAYWMAQLLEALGHAGRFQLALQMLGSAGKQAVAALIVQLKEALAAVEARDHENTAGAQEASKDEQQDVCCANADVSEGGTQPDQASRAVDALNACDMQSVLDRVCTVFGVAS